MDNRPFQLIQTCSCQSGNKCQECHFPMLVGLTYAAALAPCSRVPKPGAQPLTLQRSLTGFLLHLPFFCSLTNMARHRPRRSCQSKHKLFAVLVRQQAPAVIPRPQRTPDSNPNRSPQCERLDSKLHCSPQSEHNIHCKP